MSMRFWTRHLPQGSDLVLHGRRLWCRRVSVGYGRETNYAGNREYLTREVLLMDCATHTWPENLLPEDAWFGAHHNDVSLLIGDEEVPFGLSVVIASDTEDGVTQLKLERFFSSEYPDDLNNAYMIFPTLRHKLQVGPEYEKGAA